MLAALLALLAAALVVSGCGASLDPVAQAATRTSDVSTLRFSMELKMQVPAVATAIPVTADGAIDAAAHRMRLSMDLSKAAALSGRSEAPTRMTLIEDGLTMYMSGAALGAALPDGKSWVSLDLSKMSGLPGVDLSSLTSGPTDPRTSLAQLEKAGNVVKVGSGEVRGASTTRYSVLVDLRQGLDKLEGAQREAMETLLDRLGTAGRYVPADVWVDEDGYLRRFRMAIPNYLGTGSSFSLTMDLFAFGEPVAIDVPAPSDVADLTALVSGTPGG